MPEAFDDSSAGSQPSVAVTRPRIDPASPAPLEPALVEAYWFVGALMIVKATGDETNGGYEAIEQLAAPGYSPPMHLDHAQDEAFFMIEGTIEFTLDDRSWVAGPGSFVVLPRGVRHGFRVVGESPYRALVVTSPASPQGFLTFVRRAGVRATSLRLPERADLPADIVELAAEHGVELLP